MTRGEACGLILCIMTDHRPTVSAIKQTGNGTGLSWSRWCMLLIRPAHIDVGTMYQLNTTISFTLTIIVGSEHSKYDPMSCYQAEKTRKWSTLRNQPRGQSNSYLNWWMKLLQARDANSIWNLKRHWNRVKAPLYSSPFLIFFLLKTIIAENEETLCRKKRLKFTLAWHSFHLTSSHLLTTVWQVWHLNLS